MDQGTDMKAQLVDTDYYEVADGEKWYSAKRRNDSTFFVTNHRGHVIKDGSTIHRRVVAAVHVLDDRRILGQGLRAAAADRGRTEGPSRRRPLPR